MSGSCVYSFDPEAWNQENQPDTSLEEVWHCPHDNHVDTDYCIFHLPMEERENLGVTDVDLRDALLNKLNTTGDMETKRFVGAIFGDLELEGQTIGSGDGDYIDLRHISVNGGLDLSGSTLTNSLKIDCSSFRQVEAPNVEIQGDVVFREGYFDGEVNFDGAVFGGNANFRQTDFDLAAEFSEAEFQGKADFRYSEFEGVRTIFHNASFREEARFNGTRFSDADFTRAKFDNYTDFSNVDFNGEADFQYAKFGGKTRVRDADFRKTSNFRGVSFDGETDFSESTFNGWVTFRDTSFNSDASYREVRFNNSVMFVSESDEKGIVVDLGNSVVRSGSIEIPMYNDVVYDFHGATVGNLNISTEHEDQNPFENIRFLETKFDGFDFSEHKDDLKERDWIIHRTKVHDEDPSPDALEATYSAASMGAKALGEKKIAGKFRNRDMRYKRSVHRAHGNRVRWLFNAVYGGLLGYGADPKRILLILLAIGALAVGAVVVMGM